MAQIQKGTTYATGTQVTANNLNTHVDGAILLHGAINEQVSGTVFSSDNVLLAGTSSLKKATITQVQSGLVRSDGTVAMSGELQLSSSSPSAALKAASKGYVDAAIVAATSAIVAQAAPTGVIMAWPASTPPTGWLECNGQAATTAALQAVVGVNVPDLRGQFIRGWDHNLGIDPARTIRTSQAPYAGYNVYGFLTDDGDNQAGPRGEVNSVTINGELIVPVAAGPANYTKTINTQPGDTRPTNVALMFIIKT